MRTLTHSEFSKLYKLYESDNTSQFIIEMNKLGIVTEPVVKIHYNFIKYNIHDNEIQYLGNTNKETLCEILWKAGIRIDTSELVPKNSDHSIENFREEK